MPWNKNLRSIKESDITPAMREEAKSLTQREFCLKYFPMVPFGTARGNLIELGLFHKRAEWSHRAKFSDVNIISLEKELQLYTGSIKKFLQSKFDSPYSTCKYQLKKLGLDVTKIHREEVHLSNYHNELPEGFDKEKFEKDFYQKGYKSFKIWFGDLSPMTCFRVLLRNGIDVRKLQSSGFRAKVEWDLEEYFQSLGCKCFHATAGKVTPFELDLYFPDKRVAFEFNGYYWHSSRNVKPKFHTLKTEACSTLGIKLYQLWENTSYELKVSIMKAKLGMNNKIYARNLVLDINPTKDELLEFFNESHVDGCVKSSYSAVLRAHDGSIKAGISLRRSRVGWEVARFANALNTQVVGGYSRLLKAAELYLSQMGVKELVSYCNRDLTPDWKSSVYLKLGFSFVGDSGPILKFWCNKSFTSPSGYIFKAGNLYNRELFQSTSLKRIFGELPVGESVEAFLKKYSLYSVRNSGNWKFIKRISSIE